MPSNVGSQVLSLKYGASGNSDNINKRFKDVRLVGIYSGGSLVVIDTSHIKITPLICEVSDGTHQIKIQTTVDVTLSISSAAPYVILRWSYTGNSLDYAELLTVASGSLLDNDVIIGKGVFTGGGNLNSVTYSERTNPEYAHLALKVIPTEDTELKVLIKSGRIQNGTQTINIPEQKSSLFTVPLSDSRIDLVYINPLTGAVSISQGVAAANPSAPSYAGKIVLAEITLASTSTDITVDMISDKRAYITKYPPDGDSVYIETDVNGNYTLVDNSIESTKVSKYLPSQIIPGWYMKYHTSGSLTLPAQFNFGDPSGRLISLGQITQDFGSSAASSFLFEMKIYNNSGGVKAVTQKLRNVDDNVRFFLNTTNFKTVSGAGVKNEDITWNLIAGENTLQIIFNNTGGYGGFVLLGDIINSTDIYFVGAV